MAESFAGSQNPSKNEVAEAVGDEPAAVCLDLLEDVRVRAQHKRCACVDRRARLLALRLAGLELPLQAEVEQHHHEVGVFAGRLDVGGHRGDVEPGDAGRLVGCGPGAWVVAATLDGDGHVGEERDPQAVALDDGGGMGGVPVRACAGAEDAPPGEQRPRLREGLGAVVEGVVVRERDEVDPGERERLRGQGRGAEGVGLRLGPARDADGALEVATAMSAPPRMSPTAAKGMAGPSASMRQPTLRPSITSPTAAISTRAGGGEGVGGGVGLGVGAWVGVALAVTVVVGGAGVVVGDEGVGSGVGVGSSAATQPAPTTVAPSIAASRKASARGPRRRSGAKQPLALHADVALAGDDEVVVEGNAEGPARRRDVAGEVDVASARRGASRGVVVAMMIELASSTIASRKTSAMRKATEWTLPGRIAGVPSRCPPASAGSTCSSSRERPRKCPRR